MRNIGLWLVPLLCCVYPLAFHFAALWFTRAIASRDWSNLNYDAFAELFTRAK